MSKKKNSQGSHHKSATRRQVLKGTVAAAGAAAGLIGSGKMVWGQSEAPAVKKPVKLVQWDSNPRDYRTRHYQLTAEKFQKENPNVEIEYVAVPIANYQQKLLSAITAGTAPAVFDMWYSWAAQYVGLNSLLSLEPYLADWPRLNEFVPANLRASRFVDDTAYVMAADLFLQGTHYRKDLVEAAGLPDPRELDEQGKWDWDAFSRTAQALHKPDENIFGVSMRGGIGADFTIFNMMISATGGRWFDDNNQCLLGSPEAIAALKWYSGLATDLNVVQPSAATDGFREFTSLFYSGNAGMMIHNDDGINALPRLGPEKYQTAQMPASPAGVYMGLVGYGLSVNSKTPHPDVAAEYAIYFVENYREINSEARLEITGKPDEVIPIAPMVTDRDHPILQSALYDPFYDAVTNHPEKTFVNPYWLPDYAGLTEQMVVSDFQRILTGGMTPEEAGEKWASAFTQAQREYLERRG